MSIYASIENPTLHVLYTGTKLVQIKCHNSNCMHSSLAHTTIPANNTRCPHVHSMSRSQLHTQYSNHCPRWTTWKSHSATSKRRAKPRRQSFPRLTRSKSWNNMCAINIISINISPLLAVFLAAALRPRFKTHLWRRVGFCEEFLGTTDTSWFARSASFLVFGVGLNLYNAYHGITPRRGLDFYFGWSCIAKLWMNTCEVSCVQVSIYTYTFYMYNHTYKNVNTCICVYIYVHISICVYKYINIYIFIYMYQYIYIYYIYIHRCNMYMERYTCIHVYTYANMHICTRRQASSASRQAHCARLAHSENILALFCDQQSEISDTADKRTCWTWCSADAAIMYKATDKAADQLPCMLQHNLQQFRNIKKIRIPFADFERLCPQKSPIHLLKCAIYYDIVPSNAIGQHLAWYAESQNIHSKRDACE